jgi:hypothetical protein
MRRSLRAIAASCSVAAAASSVDELGILDFYANCAQPAQDDCPDILAPICAHERNLTPHRFWHHDLDRHFPLFMIPLASAGGRPALGRTLVRHVDSTC